MLVDASLRVSVHPDTSKPEIASRAKETFFHLVSPSQVQVPRAESAAALPYTLPGTDSPERT